jgi:hypothetical protein
MILNQNQAREPYSGIIISWPTGLTTRVGNPVVPTRVSNLIVDIRWLVLIVWIGFYARGIPKTIGSSICITKVSNFGNRLSHSPRKTFFSICQSFNKTGFLLASHYIRVIPRLLISSQSTHYRMVIFKHFKTMLKSQIFCHQGSFAIHARSPLILLHVAKHKLKPGPGDLRDTRTPGSSPCACC